MSLAHLGLTVDQERLYRYLLRNPHADLDRAPVELTMPDTARVIGELRTLGLVDTASAALAPAAAVDLLVRRRVEEAQRWLTSIGVAWDVLAELTEEQRSGRSVKLVEHLTDGPSVTRRMRELMTREPREFVHLKTRAREPARVYDATPFKRALAAGLHSRTLFSAHVLQEPEQESYARSWHALGDLHRVTSEPFRHLAVVNNSVAFVQADATDPRAGALQIRQPGVVAMLAEVFEGMWERARDLHDLPLSPMEQRALHALTEHDTDEAAARSINVSVRKFRSHVAELMSRLGASTRFQAALRAKERGWL
ncbi:hypothetical protein [Streptomyces chartreusis]|uniref:hypothetical protein n=1 Tax=Streptomyces chartreusis TaxID=1969 RepID=UPI00340C2D84